MLSQQQLSQLYRHQYLIMSVNGTTKANGITKVDAERQDALAFAYQVRRTPIQLMLRS